MTDDTKPRMFNIGTPRKSEFKPDGTINLDAPVGSEFDEVLDPLNDMLTGRNKSLPSSRHGTAADGDPIQTARERQRIERLVNHLKQNLKLVLSDMLAPQRVAVEGVTHDRNMNFTVHAINRGDGQRISTTITVDEAMCNEASERDAFTALCRKLAEKILTARDRSRS